MSRNVPHRRWTDTEKKCVECGDVPEGRTYLQAASYAHKHGIPWKELRKGKCKWFWSPTEDAALLAGNVVPDRSWESIRQHKELLGIPREAKPRYSDYVEFSKYNKTAPKVILRNKNG